MTTTESCSQLFRTAKTQSSPTPRSISNVSTKHSLASGNRSIRTPSLPVRPASRPPVQVPRSLRPNAPASLASRTARTPSILTPRGIRIVSTTPSRTSGSRSTRRPSTRIETSCGILVCGRRYRGDSIGLGVFQNFSALGLF
jgi:hypothetical protein